MNACRPAVLLMCATMAAAPSAAEAAGDLWFLGVGNDEFKIDVYGMAYGLDRLAGERGASLQSSLRFDRGGADILADIGWLAANADRGDVAMFYYSGHGDWAYDDSGEERAGWTDDPADETIGRRRDWCTDDELAAALGAVAPDVPVVAIFDACYAGGMVGGASDLNTLDEALVMMSSGEMEDSWTDDTYGVFSTGLIEGIAPGLPADADYDGAITYGEWFDYAFDGAWGQTPCLYDTGDWAAMDLFGAICGLDPLGGDADGDGDVDLDDFVILKTHFGAVGVGWAQGDFDADEDVDLADFVILRGNFGGGHAVGEPNTIILATLCGFGLAVLKRR